MRKNTNNPKICSSLDRKQNARRRLLEAKAVVIRASLEALEQRQLLSFSPAVAYATGSLPISLVVADLNGDTRPDLAVANLGSSTVSVLLGNGNGTFQSAAGFATGTSPRNVAAGDFNGDGKLDLATANDSGLSILLNNGAGTFGAPANISIGNTPSSVAVGDFNADGKLDLVATSQYYQPGSCYYSCYPGYNVSTVKVLLGNGAGSFTPAGSTQFGYGGSVSTAVADFNGDGKLDLAAVSPEGWAIEVLLGSGTGTLGSPSYFVGGYARSVAAGDVNGDGKLDLIAGSSYGDGVRVALGDGAGGFWASQSYAAGSNAGSVAIADFNGDGKKDLITAGDGSASVLLGKGSGEFQPPITVAAGSVAVSVAVGDFNADGRPDAATANLAANTAAVLINNNVWPALDAPTITIGDVTVTEGNTGTVSATFTISLSAASTQAIAVQFATADGSATVAAGDYQATSGILTFAPGETSKPITVLVNGDHIAENSEGFSVRLSDSTNSFISDSTGAGTILDNEPRITISYGSVREGNSGTTPMSFTVRLSAASDVPVSVNYSTAEGDTEYWPWYGYYYYYYPPPIAATSGVDYQEKHGTLTFEPGQTEIILPIQVIGDRVGEPNEVLSVNLADPTGGGIIISGHAVGTIIDDEPYASITGGQIVEGNSGSAALAFTVTLSAASDEPVTVNYATSDGSATVAGNDYQAKSGTLTFAPNVTTQTFLVQVNGDRLAEPNEYFLATLSGATNAGIATGAASGIIIDNEPFISVASGRVNEGNSGTRLMTFTVSLSAAYDQTVTVNFSTADGSATVADGDYVAKSGTLSFAPGETKKTFTVTIRGDKRREPDEYFSVLLTSASNNVMISTAPVWGTIVNDDGRAPHKYR